MIVRRADRVVVQGMTGRQGSFWTEKMLAYGTCIVGGVNPKRAGETHVGVPVFVSVHGTGEEEAVALIRQRLRREPYDRMEDAVRAAVEAAR